MQLFEDRIGGGSPLEWLAIGVVGGDEVVDALHELLDAGEPTDATGTAEIAKKAVTTLLRCDGTGWEVTALLRNPWKPASLLGFGPPAVIVNGGVTTLVSQL